MAEGYDVVGFDIERHDYGTGGYPGYLVLHLKPGSGADWFDGGPASHGSRSDSRKAASAQIAKIPFPLAQHIARCFRGSTT